jgi:SpoIVB peptidase S55
VHVRSHIAAAFAASLLTCLAAAAAGLPIQPVNAPILPLADVRPGMQGQVWTVFQGTRPEPFTVEVSGIIRNALGPGKDLILCRLTDPRVQDMGAVAGMSGSPLYIDGRLAGALSYQLQRFETVHYAGFTPIEDLLEVSRLPAPPADVSGAAPIPLQEPAGPSHPTDATPDAAGLDSPFRPLTPVFNLSGIDPEVASLFAPRFAALGLDVAAAGGSYGAPGPLPGGAIPGSGLPVTMRPGDAVSVALATGDITIAGTGTVSSVNGDHLLAFGHQLMRLGAVDLPMAATDVVAILPSQMSSYKVANIGRVIGTISQDRLSAVYGDVGRMPAMIPIRVTVPDHGATRTLRFNVVRQPQLAPLIAAAGLAQGILGSNDAGMAEGFRVRRTVTFPGGPPLTADDLYAGPQGFAAGLGDFVQDLSAWLQNPFEKTYPTRVTFAVQALDHNPQSVLDVVQLSRTTAAPGDTVQLTLTWRDYQGARATEVVPLPVARAWAGKTLEVVVTNGPQLDELTGRPREVPAAQIRSFGEYLALLADHRRTDGLYVAVVERTSIFLDQTRATLDYPASIARIARDADERRFQRREGLAPLWEEHLLADRIIPANVRRTLRVTD